MHQVIPGINTKSQYVAAADVGAGPVYSHRVHNSVARLTRIPSTYNTMQ